MPSGTEAPAEEILVIRRRHGGEDDHHHGGVWKIAYADFMTAMMAFFLVMWLINASNTETKASIASYFNPIKLTDNVARKKGLHEIDAKANASEKPKQSRGGKSAPHEEKGEESVRSGKGRSLEGLRDKQSATRATDGNTGPALEAARATPLGDPFNPLAGAQLLASEAQQAGSDSSREAAGGPNLRAAGAMPGASAPTRDGKSATDAADAAMDELARSIRHQAEASIRALGLHGGPGIDVTIEGDAVVLSLTDTTTFGMFAVGSAEPNADLARLVQSITPVLAETGGRIIVRGHTDGRPYRSERGNNNWRLAMARAEAVYLMLARSSVEEARFERIEAHADRRLKVPTDPNAAANRRIEILVRRGSR
jgi:chemotaxis protein MotB